MFQLSTFVLVSSLLKPAVATDGEDDDDELDKNLSINLIYVSRRVGGICGERERLWGGFSAFFNVVCPGPRLDSSVSWFFFFIKFSGGGFE